MRPLIAAGLALALAAGTARAQTADDTETALFAGGCFWCVEADFDKVPGVVETVSGYTGGDVANPSYRDVSHGGTGHYESVLITYDPDEVTYTELLHTFWRTVDPTDAGGQFCDRGESYLTAVFVADADRRAAAQASKAAAEEALGQEIVTKILDRGEFWPAEDYHQNYYNKNPQRYHYYRWGCGRDARVEELWGDAAFAGMVKKE